MKKLVLTIAIVLGLCLSSFAEYNQGGGIFHRGAQPRQKGFLYGTSGDYEPLLPQYHGNVYDADAQDGDPAPVGSGIAVLVGLGTAYLVGKKRK